MIQAWLVMWYMSTVNNARRQREKCRVGIEASCFKLKKDGTSSDIQRVKEAMKFSVLLSKQKILVALSETRMRWLIVVWPHLGVKSKKETDKILRRNVSKFEFIAEYSNIWRPGHF